MLVCTFKMAILSQMSNLLYPQVMMLFDVSAGLMTARPSGRVKYAAVSQDPFLLAAADSSRSRERRRKFKLAFAHVSNASAAIDNGMARYAAAELLKAHYHSEGFIELSEPYCSIMLDHSHAIAGGFMTCLSLHNLHSRHQTPQGAMHAVLTQMCWLCKVA